MKLRRRIILSSAAALTALSLAAPAPGQAVEAEEVTVGEAAAIPFDLVLLRPLGLIRMIVGAGMYVPSVLLTAPSAAYDRNMSEINSLTETYIREPFDFVFLRPPGMDLEGR